MRISLTNKITFALVVFGLVPASIIAWFAYDSNNDFRRSQTLLIKQAAISISDKVAPVLEHDPATLKDAIAGTLPPAAKDRIRAEISCRPQSTRPRQFPGLHFHVLMAKS